jgi:hypothetical protein
MSAQSYSDERSIVTKASTYISVSESLECLRRMVREKGLEEFALIDHSGAAGRPREAGGQASDLRRPQGRHAAHDGLAAARARPATKDPGLVQPRRRGTSELQRHILSRPPPRHPRGPRREHCGHRRARSRRSWGGLRSHGEGWRSWASATGARLPRPEAATLASNARSPAAHAGPPARDGGPPPRARRTPTPRRRGEREVAQEMGRTFGRLLARERYRRPDLQYMQLTGIPEAATSAGSNVARRQRTGRKEKA